MAKNRNGGFTPPKGKPSGNGRETTQLKDAFAVTDPEQENELRARYLNEDDEPADNVEVQHENRASQKSTTAWKNQELHAGLHDEVKDHITWQWLDELAAVQKPRCVTCYLPVHQAGMEVNQRQDASNFKALLQQAEQELAVQGADEQTIEPLLQPARELLQDTDFWNNQASGLAVFLAPGFSSVVRLPYTVRQEVKAGSCFLIRPLVPALKQQKFYLLALSKHDAQLYEGDTFGLKRRLVAGMPNGIEDVVHIEEKQDLQLFRQGSGGHGTTNFHGHSEGQLGDKKNLELYFREVDKTLFAEVLHDENAPLVLAGVEYLIPIYRGVSRYGNIAAEAITGNQEHQNEHELFEKSKEVVKPYFDEPVRKALEQYYNQLAQPLTVSMPEAVIRAAHYGQVAELFVVEDEHIWGRFNPQTNQLEIHDQPAPDDQCIIDQAIMETYRHGGNINILPRERMPKGSIIAALLRYTQ